MRCEMCLDGLRLNCPLCSPTQEDLKKDEEDLEKMEREGGNEDEYEGWPDE